ncbi:MAG: TolC family outer membrane protein [Pseudomonadota bacterium]
MSVRTRLARLAAAAAVALGAVGPGPAASETLGDALVFAYRNSNLLDQNQAVLRAADEGVADAVAALRPVFSYVLQSGYARTRQGEGTATTLDLETQLTLFDFGRNRLAIAIAKESVLAARQALVSVEQGVLLDAVRAYMDVRQATENVAINRNSVKVIGEALRAAQDRFDVGEVTRTDVALAEARLAAARAGEVAADGQLAVAREAYRAATGRYPGPLAAPPRQPRLPASLDEARAIANRTHPAILQAQHEVKAAELAVELAAAQRLPSVGLAGTVSTDGGDTTGSVGLRMTQTIYAGGALSSAHRRAIANRDRARAALLQASVSVAQQVGNAWAGIDVARAQIEAADRQIKAATVAYNGVREEAQLGARTTLDVLDAEQELLDAQANRISADASLQVAIYSLLAATGLLTAERLNLGIPTYDPAAYYDAVKTAPVTSVQGRSLDRVLKAIGKD